MLLRRVIEHVKAQNWTAVALDFCHRCGRRLYRYSGRELE